VPSPASSTCRPSYRPLGARSSSTSWRKAASRRCSRTCYRARLAGVDLSGLLARFDDGATVETGELVPASDVLARVGPVRGLAAILDRLGVAAGEESPPIAAAALEFAIEGLHLNKRLAKDELPGRTVYGG
jgi:magnesium chelatase subunit I